MKQLFLLLASSVVLFSCEKNNSHQESTCACDKPLIGGLRVNNWDGTPDTVDVYVYAADDSFTTATGVLWSKPVMDNGLVNFYISADSVRDYKIVFRQSGATYRLENFSADSDSVNCSSIGNQFHCYSTFSYMLNGSTTTTAKVYDDYLTYDGYKIPVSY